MHIQQSVIYRNRVLWIVRTNKAVCICSKEICTVIAYCGLYAGVQLYAHAARCKIYEIRIVGNTTVLSCMHMQQGVKFIKFVLWVIRPC
jgi:hypothetical protein